MEIENLTQHIETASGNWQPSRIEGVDILPLRTDRSARKGTLLVRMSPGSRYTRHRHPKGEEMLLLKGVMQVEGRNLKAGDFLYSPPGSVHELFSDKGCMFLLILPEPTEIISGGRFEDLEMPPDPASPSDSTS